MKNEKCRKTLMRIAVGAAILMLMIGIFMVYHVFDTYHTIVLSNQDSQLLNWARVIDKIIASSLNEYREELADVSRRMGMQNALNEFLYQHKTENLLYRLNENLVTRDPLIETMLLEKDGKIIIAANGRTDYLQVGKGTENALYMSENGSYYLAFRAVNEEADFVALFNLARYYNTLMDALPVKTDRLMLMCYEYDILIHQWQGVTRVDHIGELNETNCDYQALQMMLQSCMTGETKTASYSIGQHDAAYNARLAVVPQQATSNACLSVALTVSEDALLKPLEQNAVKLIISCALAVVGAVLVVLILINATLKDRKTIKELKLLREKNAEMERLTDKTLKLAHHQRLETIGTLTSSIAHEFNNLLTPIMGYSIMTLEKLPPECEELSDNIEEIYNASRKAKVMISRLNELSRKGSDSVSCRFAMDDLVQKTMAVARPAKPKQVQTELRLKGQNRKIFGNELQLSQMMLNLVLNGYQAMENVEGMFIVETSVEEDIAVITVKDNGIGIASENLEKIFDPFFTTKETGKGTGLGLAIAKEAAEAHGGTIEVHSKPGEGTVFTVRLPLAPDEPDEEIA